MVVDGVPEDLRRRAQCETLRFESRGLNFTHVVRQCDAAILNATHGTTISMLLGGVPVLLLPIYLEQTLFARTVERLGAGLYANPKQPEEVVKRLDAFLGDDRYADAARRFAQQHADHDAPAMLDEMVDRLEELIAAS